MKFNAHNVQDDPAVPLMLRGRQFGGFTAAKLAIHAADVKAMQRGEKRPGAAQRFLHITQWLFLAVTAFMKVSRALKILSEPLVLSRARNSPHKPRSPRRYIWRKAPRSEKDWAVLGESYRFDVRGTSASHIMQRARSARVRTRRKAQGEFYQATKPKRVHKPTDFIGPPAPKDHRAPDDFFMIWPPITPKDMAVLPETSESPAITEPAVIGNILWARRQYGPCGVLNYLKTVTESELSDLFARAPPRS